MMLNKPPFSALPKAGPGLAGLARRDAYLPWVSTGDDCCHPPKASHPDGAPGRTQRSRLKDLASSMYCSVIGTCLGVGELRPLVARFQEVAAAGLSELDIHHGAVELAVQAGDGAKALNKALDQRHALAIQRFAQLETLPALEQAWREAVQRGDIAGPYWALLTHPAVTEALRKQAFGEVHMLSHLQGVSSRADLAHLQALAQENSKLREQRAQQQERQQVQQQTHQQTQLRLQEQIQALQLQALRPAVPASAELTLRAEVLAQQLDRMSHERDRNAQSIHTLQSQCQELQTDVQALRQQVHDEQRLNQALRAEAAALEAALASASQSAQGRPEPGLMAGAGQRVLYVGGRPSSNGAIRRLCDAAGVELLLHDGGLEDRKGLLPALVPGSDLVLLPVDCVDHDSMNQLKKLCARHGVPFQPLRTAGVASFLAALAAHSSDPTDTQAPRPRPICLRHG